MIRIISFFIIGNLLFISQLIAQHNNVQGNSFIQNYNDKNYKTPENQTWAIIQDQRGVMYFGNNDGLLEFDGTNFKEKWVSENLGGQIWSLAAGNFDEDSEYEIAVTTSPGDNQGIIYVFDYVPGSSNPPVYTKTTIEPIGEGAIARMFAGNANNDPAMKKDLVVGTSTSVMVYDAPNGYTQPFFYVDIGAIVREIYLK